jgi:hypothetical protein
MPRRSAHASFVIRAVRFTTTYCLRYVVPTYFNEAAIYDPPTAPQSITSSARARSVGGIVRPSVMMWSLQA